MSSTRTLNNFYRPSESFFNPFDKGTPISTINPQVLDYAEKSLLILPKVILLLLGLRDLLLQL
jgi:hypothetical protein